MQCLLFWQVDIVYLAMLHTGHCAAALLMIGAGKHVLVEKPFAMNEKEARKMVHAAKKKVTYALGMHACGSGDVFPTVGKSEGSLSHQPVYILPSFSFTHLRTLLADLQWCHHQRLYMTNLDPNLCLDLFGRPATSDVLTCRASS